MFNPHLFDLILVDSGEPKATTVEHRPATQRRFEASAEHKAVIRFDNGRLHVWITHEANPDVNIFEAHLAHARMVDFSDHAVIFEGAEVRGFEMTGRTARVTFTNKHHGW